MYNKKRSLSPLAYRGHCTPFYTLVIPYVFSSTVKKKLLPPKKLFFYQELCLGLHTGEDEFTFTRNINFAASSINKGCIALIQTKAFILTAE